MNTREHQSRRLVYEIVGISSEITRLEQQLKQNHYPKDADDLKRKLRHAKDDLKVAQSDLADLQ